MAPRDRPGFAEQTPAGGDVEERLVERQPFDERRENAEDRENLPRDLLVAVHPRPHADGMRASPQRLRIGIAERTP